MNAKAAWTEEVVADHLQQAIHLELWTIPLYLTAAYSIKDVWDKANPLGPSGPHAGNDAYTLVMSVAVQEMFHLTLACNLANAFGATPSADTAGTGLAVPTYPPTFKALNMPDAKLGNIVDAIDTMIAVEAPDQQGPPPTTPEEPYDSIGDFYSALWYGITQVYPTTLPGAGKGAQKGTFESKYGKPGFTTLIYDMAAAHNALLAIVDEGEGGGTAVHPDYQDVPKLYWPNPGGLYYSQDERTHWQRFLDVKAVIESLGTGVDKWVYAVAGDPGQGAAAAQQQLCVYFTALMREITTSMQSPGAGVNLRGMGSIGSAIAAVWEQGALPDWRIDETACPPTSAEQDLLPPFELHVCQGLNACAGQGAVTEEHPFGSGTMAGDGECATVVHACQNTNDCRGQGGCGTGGGGGLVSEPAAWLAGQNECKGLGGCQSPIHDQQYFGDAFPKHGAFGNYVGKRVWPLARELFEARMAAQGRPVAPRPTTVSAARQGPGTNPTPPAPPGAAPPAAPAPEQDAAPDQDAAPRARRPGRQRPV